MIYTAEMMNPLFAFVDRLDGIEQSPIYHPEGCVLTHTMQVTNLAFRETIDTDLILAALLHDVIEDTDYSKDDITEKFGRTVAELVDGVTKLSHSSDKEYNKAASFRKILQATLQDPRVIIVKLADRYYNMTTLDALRPDKRARIAQETFDVFVLYGRVS